MNEKFLDLLKNAELDEYQKQLILFVVDENYQSLYYNLVKNAKINNFENEWETVFFRTILQTQLYVVNGKINPDNVLSYVYQKVTSTMDAKHGISLTELQKKVFPN